MADRELDEAEKQHSVIDGVLLRTSVSAIQAFDPSQDGGCHRRWYFDKVLHIKQPGTKAQKRGVELHAKIEHFIKTGEDVLPPIARAGKHFMPRGQGIETELKFGMADLGLTAAGVPLVGYIDVFNTSGVWIDEQGDMQIAPPGTIEVLDWKTTSAIDSWAKTPAGLIKTVQMPGYAEYARRKIPDLKQVRLSHVYLQTEGRPASKKVTTLISLDTIQSRWATVDKTVQEMKEVAKAKDISDVQPTLSSCAAFRGCPYQDRCPRSKSAILAGLFGVKTMSLLDRVRGTESVAGTAATTAPASTPTPSSAVPVVQPTAAEIAAAKAKLLAEEQASSAASAAAQTATLAPPPPVKSTEVAPGYNPEPYKYHLVEQCRTGVYYWLPEGNTGKGVYARANVRTDGNKFAFILADGNACQLPIADQVAYIPSNLLPKEKLEAFQKMDAARAAPPPPPPPAPATPPPPPPQASAASATPAPSVAAAPVPVPSTPLPIEPRVPILPPDAPQSVPGLSAEPIPAESLPTLSPAVQAVIRPEEVLGGAGTAVQPEKKTRKKKAETAAALAATAPTTAITGLPAGASTTETPPALMAVVESEAALEIFVDCVPDRAYTKLNDYVDKFCEALCEQYKAVDIRCAPKDSVLAFSGWRGALTALVKHEPPAPGTYVIFARHNEIMAVVAEALATESDLFVRGVQ